MKIMVITGIALVLTVSLMITGLIYSMSKPISDIDSGPCLHPCACEEADNDCAIGVKICNMEDGKCVCICAV